MKRRSSLTAGQFIEELLGQGRYTFAREEAERRLGTSQAAAYMTLHRLVKAGRLVMPRSGFYVIVDPQHRAAGTLPPEWFIHELVKGMGRPYYVGLLSAAQIHGAAHHRPQEFQVVIPTRTIRPIRVGNVRIRFFGKGPFDCSETVEVKTPTGFQKVSTPETTAWDLVRYPRAAGGLGNVVTVLSELEEHLDVAKLRKTVRRHDDLLVAQRLGYLLDQLSRRDLTRGLADWVQKEDAPLRPLDPALPVARGSESRKWHLVINAELEPEA
ncbi:MAG: type IV toxin-antitoxin system AbiEi family antitoxin [Candidatus Tectomicrobia bacterium]|uniref:Type IV toxin-antitoxin system AbiEi family antitoxin n=1 Tax=Tectimicrobiota bacterium TaxID=2528274 RepID=A0A932GRX4_UNCTE|nr:type IV toxin-antitoxin system AbiEi family antitoxin [Candidatus Tectomicrobia bacterium]